MGARHVNRERAQAGAANCRRRVAKTRYKRRMRQLSRILFRLAGWRTEGAVPPEARYVLIAAPHTSNWDAVVMLLAARIFGIELKWFIKDTWFVFPVGILMRALGGVPIDRSARHGMVERAIERFA